MIAQYNGYAHTYGTDGFCNSYAIAGTLYTESFAGGGGPSGCATGAPSVSNVVSGTCAGYAKPSWQSLLGVPNDGVRDLPDVSLFSSGGPQATGPWHQTYVWCFSDTSRGGTPCTVSPGGWTFGGFGTSFATPIWAGIQALLNQQAGQTREGMPNYRLYQIAADEYTCCGNGACYSNSPLSLQASCIFYDVTVGDTDVPCRPDNVTLIDCYYPSGSLYGVMSTSYTSYAPTFQAQTGWDFATGIGTVNVANLVANWLPKNRAGMHDFNADSRSDILWRDTSGNVALWLMDGGTVRSSTNVSNVPTSWSIVGQRDFDGYDRSDILWHDTSGNTAIWFMNGAAVLASAAIGNVPAPWSIVGTGDFNLDGKADILWRNTTTGNVAIWLMNGATISSSVGVGNVPTSWSIVANTYNSIYWRDTSGNTALWLMEGGTVLGNYSLGNVSTAWSVVGTGDFDGNGIPDILWRDSSGNTAIWFMGYSGQITSAAFVANVATTWSVAETGDFNGDGKSDIFWRDAAGNTAIWFMNGATVSSSVGLGNVGAAWTVQNVNAD